LGEHISDAQKAAEARREDADPDGAAKDDNKTSAPEGESSAPERDDPVGSRMPGHASGGDD
jgi:hypothetical protein